MSDMRSGHTLSATARLLTIILFGLAITVCFPITEAWSDSQNDAGETSVDDSRQIELLDRLAGLIRLEIDGLRDEEATLTRERAALIRQPGAAARQRVLDLDADLTKLDRRRLTLERELADATALRHRTAGTSELIATATAKEEDETEVKDKKIQAPSPEAGNTKKIQEALIYVGDYDGRIDGRLGPRSRVAVERFQKHLEAEPTGTLNDIQQAKLFDEAEVFRRQHGVRTLEDRKVGYRLDYPGLLLPKTTAETDGGRTLASSDDTASLIVVVEDQVDLEAAHAEQSDRPDISYSRLRADWFVLAGRKSGDKIFYEVARRDADHIVRARLTHPATEKNLWDPFKVVLFNSFSLLPEDRR